MGTERTKNSKLSDAELCRPTVMKHISSSELTEKVAQYLLSARGYVVIGPLHGYTMEIGEIVYDLWRQPTTQPFQIIAETSAADWEEQRRLAAPLIGFEYKGPVTYGGDKFFRAVTD